MITEDYVSLEVAKLLKEKGFDVNSLMVYNQNGNFMPAGAIEDTYQVFYAAPTIQMAMKWLREVHKIEIRVIYDNERLSWYGACNPMNELSQILLGFGRKSKSYEEACEEAINYALKKLI